MTFPVMKIYMHFTCTAVWHDIQGFVFLITDVRNNLPNLGYLVNT